MRLSWRAALAYAANGWPVIPWRGQPLEPFASTEVGVIEGWAEQYPDDNAAVDLVQAGLVVIEVQGSGPDSPGYREMAAMFDRHQWWPDAGSLTVSTPSGGWHWYLLQPDPPLEQGPLADRMRIMTQYAEVPGSTDQGAMDSGPWATGVYALEWGADLDAGPCPDWLRSRTRV